MTADYGIGKDKPETTIHLPPGSLEHCIADPLLRKFVSDGYRRKLVLPESGPYLRLDKPDGSFVVLSRISPEKTIIELHYIHIPYQKST
ncbi:MAG TPA: hypothetical protein VKE88_03420 [Candidatus Nanoarchaeia archaeon]|nr:hypothetical protein [Candidatus Nanoarchaeia archaeon]